jgi:SAM-dependent methyltransferase
VTRNPSPTTKESPTRSKAVQKASTSPPRRGECYLPQRVTKSTNDWDELGAREPYFAVLSQPRFLLDNLDEEALEQFYSTGEEDVERILELAGRPAVNRALEFGCGVGRLTIPMSHRVSHVVGLDAAESLLRLARESAASRQIVNAEFRSVELLDGLAEGSFDLVYSYIVFQHIPVRAGENYLRKLLDKTAPGGTAVLHFTTSRAGGAVRRMLRRVRANSRVVHRLASWLRGERDLPYMQMNEYDEARIGKILIEAGFEVPRTVPTDHGGVQGALFVSRRRSAR